MRNMVKYFSDELYFVACLVVIGVVNNKTLYRMPPCFAALNRKLVKTFGFNKGKVTGNSGCEKTMTNLC